MLSTVTPSCLHDVTFFSLSKPRSAPYNSGARPKACLWRSSEGTTCCSSLGFPFSTSYCVIRPCALSARNTLWPNSMGVCTLPRLVNDAAAQTAEMLDLLAQLIGGDVGNRIFAARFLSILDHRSCAVDHLVGNADELAICAGLLLLPLLRGHPLDFL